MRINEVVKWANNIPYIPDNENNYYESYYAEMIKNYRQIKNKKVLSHDEAEMLIASDDHIASAIFEYKYQNTISSNDANRIAIILHRIKPFKYITNFYRGEPIENNNHLMPFKSWSANIETAKLFAEKNQFIYRTIGNIQGIEISNVFYWHHILKKEGSGLGDAQAEWLLLNDGLQFERIRST